MVSVINFRLVIPLPFIAFTTLLFTVSCLHRRAESPYVPSKTKVGKYTYNPMQIERKIHSLVNMERRQQGIKDLKWNEKLAIIARKHSKDMAQRDYFSHLTPEGEGPTERAKKEHFPVEKPIYGGMVIQVGIAENIFKGYMYTGFVLKNGKREPVGYKTENDIAKEVVYGWMHSKGHRANILNSDHDEEGIGVYIRKDGTIFVTEDFY